MSKEQAKAIFKDGVTTWEKQTMDEYTDVVYEDIDKAKDYIIETGSNSEATWEKWASGKMQLVIGVTKPIPANGHHNIIVDLPVSFQLDLLKTFANATVRTASANVSSMRVTRAWLSAGNKITISVESTSSGAQNGVFQILVIGRWK